MILYSEEKYRHLSTFKKTILSNDGEIKSQRKVTCPLYFIKQNDFTYIILYNDQMQVIHDAFEYLNYTMSSHPITTRRGAAHAIRLLYCYLSLAGYSDREINQKVFDGLITFLKGINPSSNNSSMQTVRSGNTINAYLSTYRSYFRARQIQCKPLFESRTTTVDIGINDESIKIPLNRYTNNVKVQVKDKTEIPKYISPDEFRCIYSLALEQNDKTSTLIMHLMYGYGLRLGEVLGITTEDLTEIHDNGNLIPIIILRNRLSDAPFQYAKGLMHPTDTYQYYHDTTYKQSSAKIHLDYKLYESIIDYVNEYHSAIIEKYPQNYADGYADIVSYRDKPETNHYIFLNRYGKVMSAQTFNNKLKEYYKEAGIPLDYGVKKDNLGHRFRHGFAMMHAYFSESPVDVLKLQKMMRHKSVSSTMVYYNPTETDKLRINTEFQEELYAMIPELKENFYGRTN